MSNHPKILESSTAEALSQVLGALERIAATHKGTYSGAEGEAYEGCDTCGMPLEDCAASQPGNACDGHLARAARAAWGARLPLVDDAEALRAVGDEIAAHLLINLPRNQRDFVAAGALRAIDRALAGSRP